MSTPLNATLGSVQPVKLNTEKARALNATEIEMRLAELRTKDMVLQALKQIMIDQQGGKQNTQMNE
jgi:hypothetical protein